MENIHKSVVIKNTHDNPFPRPSDFMPEFSINRSEVADANARRVHEFNQFHMPIFLARTKPQNDKK